ncbi:KamA family radical SAM protein [Haliangium ochraceum]|uniref:Lysine 2,3-aminomutase YodO family protein n=1 Tax=Haliangium ochraceum (strain DSM 14365 / JCM 11303 / SMP-2) TaxID=502025 RepID=D0LHG0_HALO1|nr:KamA family radical SAM protein [Haliangium ochraceum]ACY12822.1 lysine 2,3-aminomutase YodO family protein [Haliangium ochraceum DSM 14365]
MVKLPTVANAIDDAIVHLKAPVDPATLAHRHLLDGPFWQRIPAYKEVSEEQFLDHKWQAKNSITKPAKLLAALQEIVPQSFYDDVAAGFRKSPMSVRVSPYLLSLIDWDHPYEDPLRTQFIPLGSRLTQDHPKLSFDSLHEQADAPVPGLTHRYVDKALFLTLDTCPVYCRFCTRSYAVGIDTEDVEKVSLKAREDRWDQAFRYVAARPELEDIVISGGDSYQLKARQIRHIGETLLGMDNIRRIRFATKGPAVMPQKLITDTEWLDALTGIVELGRKLHKEVALHTHFNHPNEITAITKQAMDILFERGITVRNQSVLQRGVNDTVETMQLLVKRLSYLNVQPYYVYMHDMVKGVEDLRTTIQTGLDIEKHVRGITAGFNTPTFVVDAPGGGGKRAIHSYEYYDRDAGICVYTAPSVKAGYFLYFDPIYALTPEYQERWADDAESERMIAAAIERAGRGVKRSARASTVPAP